MTAFIIIAAVMVLAAIVLATWPLWRAKLAENAPGRERWLAGAVVAVVLPLGAGLLYPHLSNWNWRQAEQTQAASAGMDEVINKLEARLQQSPDDVEGWILLGRSDVALSRFPRAIEAYQKAYDLTKGENLEAVTGLAEALALTDEASLNGGKAGQLIEAALRRSPNHPKALWYGAMAALNRNDLRVARDRLQLLNAQSPPPQLKQILDRQIADLTAQLGDGAPAAPGVQTPGRAVKVAVTIAPEIAKKLGGEAALFVLARDPNGGGPPLAVQRHSTRELPLQVELSERDAMIAARNIGTVPAIEIVARVSLSGTPQAKSGDYYGSTAYTFDKDSGPVAITIDRIVP